MFEKLNALIVGRIERKRGQSVPALVAVRSDQHGIMVEMQTAGSNVTTMTTIPWKKVSRVAAVRQPNYVGDDTVLMIEHPGGVIELTPSVAGFDALLNAIELHLNGSKSRSQWQTELIAAEAGVAVSLLS